VVRGNLAVVIGLAALRYRPAFRSRAALERWQQRRFDRFARDMLARSPFYQPYVGRPLADYPLVDKTVMMDHFDRINTEGLARDPLMSLALRAESTRDFTPTHRGFSVGLSSGTSGRRGLFVASRRERELYAAAVLAKGMPGSVFRRQRIALLLRANNQLYEATGTGRTTFRYFDLQAPFSDHFDRLQLLDPTILVGPPQALRLIAEAQRSGRIHIAPDKVVAGGEVLEPIDADVIRQAFRRRVDQVYQATEGFLGITCQHGTLHLNEDLIIFERVWVDRAKRYFVPRVTDLFRSTQPIVRYRLDDVLVEREQPCPCGSVLVGLSRILGRMDDVMFLPRQTDGRLVPMFPDLVRDALALRSTVVSDYRVVQLSPTSIALRVEGPDGAAAWAAAVAEVRRAIARLDLYQPILTEGEPIQRDPGRKLRRVERRFSVASFSP
jgi:putative adenylate-forming enzyme